MLPGSILVAVSNADDETAWGRNGGWTLWGGANVVLDTMSRVVPVESDE